LGHYPDGLLAVGGVTHRRVDVLTCEPRIRVDEIGLGRPFAQLPKDELDRDSCPADHRLAKHHAGVHFDAIRECHPTFRIHRGAAVEVEQMRSDWRELAGGEYV
jgi:hypothetical protein